MSPTIEDGTHDGLFISNDTIINTNYGVYYFGNPVNTDGTAFNEKNATISNNIIENFTHAAKQSYISFAAAIIAAAEQKVDATPMEGFNATALDELLNLKERGLRSVTLLPLGYRDAANDWLVNMKKVRTPIEDFIITLN